MKNNLNIDQQTAAENAQTAHGLATNEATKESTEPPSICRVIISPDASLALDELTTKVNTLDGGKVNRSQILSSIVQRFRNSANASEIQDLRAEHFDRIAYFEALLKRAKETGVLPNELERAVPDQKRNSKAAPKGSRKTKATPRDFPKSDAA